MSFDIFLQYVERDPPLDPVACCGKVDEVVRRFGGGERDADGYFFELRDGGAVELYAGGGKPSGMLALRGMTPELCRLVFDLMKSTGWAVAIPGDELCLASLRTLPVEALLDDVPVLTVIENDEELMRLIEPGFSDWTAYRNQVVKDH